MTNRGEAGGRRQRRSWLWAVAGVGCLSAPLEGCGRTDLDASGWAGSVAPVRAGHSSSLGAFGPLPGASTSGGDGSASSVLPVGSCDPQTNVCACADGATSTTSVKGRVYDPAGVNPVYGAAVYAIDPSQPLPDLDSIPIACACSQLFPVQVNARGATDATGSFWVGCLASGPQSLVVQLGKWRMRYEVSVVGGEVNSLPALRLPRNSQEGSLPNVAISTGAADSLECLPLRMGVSASEYVGGGQGPDRQHHIHIFQGAGGAAVAGGSPASYSALWDTQADLNIHDVLLLSCEGHETYGGPLGVPLTNAQRAMLNIYGSAGGHALLSHLHYAWLDQGYFNTAAATLGTWQSGASGATSPSGLPLPVSVDTLLSDGGAFLSGQALQTWLQTVGAITLPGPTFFLWHYAQNVLTLNQPPATEWIRGGTFGPQYFSVDLPVPSYPDEICGRVAYADFHATGGPGNTQSPSCTGTGPACAAADYPGAKSGLDGTVPDGCAIRPLTPQEDALEFMLFDLSRAGQACSIPPNRGIPPPLHL